MNVYKNEKGEIAVLISHGYGAGWSTWNQPEIAYDKRVVEYWLSHKNAREHEVEEFMKSIGYGNVYCGGYSGIDLEWVNPGEPFDIDEYDGFESLVTNPRHTVLY